MNDTIYLVAYNAANETMGWQYATDARGIIAIVKEHYRRVFGSDAVTVAVDLEALTAIVSYVSYRKPYVRFKKSYRILRYRLDKPTE